MADAPDFYLNIRFLVRVFAMILVTTLKFMEHSINNVSAQKITRKITTDILFSNWIGPLKIDYTNQVIL